MSTESILLSRWYMRTVKLSELNLILLNRHGGEYFHLQIVFYFATWSKMLSRMYR